MSLPIAIPPRTLRVACLVLQIAGPLTGAKHHRLHLAPKFGDSLLSILASTVRDFRSVLWYEYCAIPWCGQR